MEKKKIIRHGEWICHHPLFSISPSLRDSGHMYTWAQHIFQATRSRIWTPRSGRIELPQPPGHELAPTSFRPPAQICHTALQRERERGKAKKHISPQRQWSHCNPFSIFPSFQDLGQTQTYMFAKLLGPGHKWPSRSCGIQLPQSQTTGWPLIFINKIVLAQPLWYKRSAESTWEVQDWMPGQPKQLDRVMNNQVLANQELDGVERSQ